MVSIVVKALGVPLHQARSVETPRKCWRLKWLNRLTVGCGELAHDPTAKSGFGTIRKDQNRLEHQECIFPLNKRSGIGWEQFQIDSKAQTTILPKFEGSFQILSGMIGSQKTSLSTINIIYWSIALPNGIETSMKRYFGQKCFQSCSDRAPNCQTPKILQTN